MLVKRLSRPYHHRGTDSLHDTNTVSSIRLSAEIMPTSIFYSRHTSSLRSSRCSASLLAPHFERFEAALQQLHFLLQLLQSRFMLHHLSQYTFYVGLRFGGHGFRGTVVGPCRLGLYELDPAFGLRPERADFVSQCLNSLCVLSLEICQPVRINIIGLVDPGVVSM